MADTETGLKWWMRYVLVPIIGGGGVIAIVVALLTKEHPAQPIIPSNLTPSSTSSQAPAVETEPRVEQRAKQVQGQPQKEKQSVAHDSSSVEHKVFFGATIDPLKGDWNDYHLVIKSTETLYFKWKVPGKVGSLSVVTEKEDHSQTLSRLRRSEGEDYAWQSSLVGSYTVSLQDSLRGKLASLTVNVE